MTNDDENNNNNNNNHTNGNEQQRQQRPLSPNSISSSSLSSTTLLCNASASALASIISRLCTHPFDTIKARIQILNTNTTTGSSHHHHHSLSPNTTLASTGTTNNMFLYQIRNIIRMSGTNGSGSSNSSYYHYLHTIKTLYRGLGVVIIGGTPGTMLYLCSYDIVKHQLSYLSLLLSSSLSSSRQIQQPQVQNSNTMNHHPTNNYNYYNFLIHFTSGMIAETIACIVYVPVDVIKERMQVQQQSQQQSSSIVTIQNHHNHPTYYYRNTYDAVRQILHTEGIRGIYRGYTATLASFGPFSALYFVFYEYFKHSIHTKTQQSYQSSHQRQQELHVSEESKTTSSSVSVSHYVEIPFHWTVMCAATAGGLASFITSPLDMAKLRLQVQRGNHIIHSTNHPNHISHVKSFPPTTTEINTPIVETYTSMIDCLQKVYRQYGIRGLFRGAGARVLHFAPATTVTMTTYETLRQYFEAYILLQQHQ